MTVSDAAPALPADKRSRLVDSAAKLIHEHGFGPTTLSDIAQEAAVPLGNVYYYFKTKQAIGEALVDRMASQEAAAREALEGLPDPVARLEAIIQATVESSESRARSGCPIGSLSAELNKEGGAVAERTTKLLEGSLRWIESQFRLLGKGSESPALAFHLVASLQGAVLLANAFHETKQLIRETKRLKLWVRSM